MRKIILASASPRRKEILGKTGFDFEVRVSGCDENIKESLPDKLVMELSALKAQDVARNENQSIIIGSDTVVAHNGEILGKPKDVEDAKRMIRSFSGDKHQVYTGVTLIVPNANKREADTVIKAAERTLPIVKEMSVSENDAENGTTYRITYCVGTDVYVLPMTDEEIDRYVSTGEPMDKAGAYAIQGLFAPYIKGIVGDYYNVVGLPLCSLYSLIKPLMEL